MRMTDWYEKLNENEKLILQMYKGIEWERLRETEERWGKAISLIQHST